MCYLTAEINHEVWIANRTKFQDIKSSQPQTSGCNLQFTFFFFQDNYSKPIWDMARFHFAYQWFKTLHFAHLRLLPLAFHNPPLRLLLEKHIFRQKQI